MNGVERPQIDPRGVAATVAVILFLGTTFALTMIDPGVSWLTSLVGSSDVGAVAYAVALVLALVLSVVGYLASRLAVLVV